ncbi:hypothetical protein, partial [Chlorogloeopsis fritschii]|uniref:hypothetical protein n=1 Tax=Chlorogloeopsis fritschii TaxID=1124 RepID=UPI00058F54F2
LTRRQVLQRGKPSEVLIAMQVRRGQKNRRFFCCRQSRRCGCTATTAIPARTIGGSRRTLREAAEASTDFSPQRTGSARARCLPY